MYLYTWPFATPVIRSCVVVVLCPPGVPPLLMTITIQIGEFVYAAPKLIVQVVAFVVTSPWASVEPDRKDGDAPHDANVGVPPPSLIRPRELAEMVPPPT